MNDGSEPVSGIRVFASLVQGATVLQGERRPAAVAEERASRAFLALLGLQLALVRGYFRLQRAERRLFEQVSRRRRGGSRGTARRLELERQRLGRELHTGAGQMLAAIRLQLEIIDAQLPFPEPPVAQALDRISRLLEESMAQVRSLSHRLHPPEWQRLRIEDALRQLWQISGVPESFLSELRIEELGSEPDLEVKVLLYRALQEALTNVVRHARATDVRLTLELRGDTLMMGVRDNGSGFDPAELAARPPGPAGGIGLRSIREQAAEIGGKLVVSSGPDGTTLELSVPFHPQQDS